jgi:transposase-like protein
MEFPIAFREAMVRKMMEPGRKSTAELAEETGVHETTLSRWVREAARVDFMSRKKIKRMGGRSDDRTPEEKLQLVLEASLLTDDELGEFLREKGLHEAQLERWRKEALAGLSQRENPSRTTEVRDLKKKIQDRDKEIRRKDKALAEAAALIVLKKKVEALWGDGEDDTE